MAGSSEGRDDRSCEYDGKEGENDRLLRKQIYNEFPGNPYDVSRCGHAYRVDVYDKGGVYKKIVSRDGVIVGALLQGDLAYGGVLQQMIARKLDVRKVRKPLFEIDYSDFFHEKANLEFAYDL